MPDEEGLARLDCVANEALRLDEDFGVERALTLLAERTLVFDLLCSVGQRPGMDHATLLEALGHFRILGKIVLLDIFTRIQVVQNSEEFIETVRRRQEFVAVAQVVLSELP